jgi:hypothetical protein
MLAVRMMQVTGNEVVHVIAMRHRLVAAARTVAVVRGMRPAVVRTAVARMGGIDLDHVFVDVVVVRVVKVTVVQVIDVVTVAHGDVAAIRSVLVRVVGMHMVLGRHGGSPAARGTAVPSHTTPRRPRRQ